MRANIFFLAVFTMIFTLTTTNLLAIDEVYRWVDENGVVHFENQAPEQTEAEKITIRPDQERGIQPTTDEFNAVTDEEKNSEASYAQQKRDDRAMKRQEAKEKEKITAAECENSRTVVAQLEPVTRVLVQQEDGSAIRMDDNERLERIREAKAYIAANCNK